MKNNYRDGGLGAWLWNKAELPVLYDHANYQGTSVVVDHDIGRLSAGTYGDFKNDAASIYIPNRWEIELHVGDNLKSRGVRLSSSVPDLRAHKINGKVSSVDVIRRGSGSGFGTLVLDWAAVIDNGEGAGWPHGPLGNIYVNVYEADHPEFGEVSGHYPSALYGFALRGPTIDEDDSKEWDDGDLKEYDQLFLFQWRSRQDNVMLFMYESDDHKNPTRNHDVPFSRTIGRTHLNKGVVLLSHRPARGDALKRALRRGSTRLLDFLDSKGAWPRSRGYSSGMPSVFLGVRTTLHADSFDSDQ